MEDSPKYQRFLALAFVVCGVVVLVLARNWPESLLSTSDLVGLFAFVVLAVIAQGYPLKVPFGNAYLGLSGTIFWALLVLFPPFWATAASLTALLISEFILQRRQWIKGIFNSGQTALSTFIGAYIFHELFGQNGLEAGRSFFLAFGVAASIYWLINTGLVSIGAKILYSKSALQFWYSNFRWAFIYELTSAPIALALAYAYQEIHIPGLLVVALPILMLRTAYSQYLELKNTYRETVRTLVKVIEMNDPYTAGHSDRVASYSKKLCEALRLSPATTEKIELAAYLHDLGKINLDLNKIVRKAGALTEDERRLIKLHSIVSADLANQVSYFRGEIEAMIRHHHENWDGSGYPHGLKQKEIPLGSRIILLADAFDAMTTGRVYREALDLEHVKNEFRKFAGIQFDPDLVPLFLDKVIGDGSGFIKPSIKEPIEGARARGAEISTKIRPIKRVIA